MIVSFCIEEYEKIHAHALEHKHKMGRDGSNQYNFGSDRIKNYHTYQYNKNKNTNTGQVLSLQ